MGGFWSAFPYNCSGKAAPAPYYESFQTSFHGIYVAKVSQKGLKTSLLIVIGQPMAVGSWRISRSPNDFALL
jgi:hypothetical protein